MTFTLLDRYVMQISDLKIHSLERFKEINQLLGFQMLVNLITNVVIVIMFGFYTTIGALDSKLSLAVELFFTLHPVQTSSIGLSWWSC